MIGQTPASIRRGQRGAAFLLLVVALLLVVTGATLQLIKRERIVRRGLGKNDRSHTMLRAIDAVSGSIDESDLPICLPLEDRHSIVIRLETGSEGRQLVAEWIHNNKLIDTIRREYKPEVIQDR